MKPCPSALRLCNGRTVATFGTVLPCKCGGLKVGYRSATGPRWICETRLDLDRIPAKVIWKHHPKGKQA
jgi:hypothetical protein